MAGADVAATEMPAGDGAGWGQVVAGPWLAETLQGLRNPQGLAGADPGAALKGRLRPYHQVGVRWLYLLTKLGLGACLADDMGLGKTIQVLALLVLLKREFEPEQCANPKPSLLIAPASLLANWASEIDWLGPTVKSGIHPDRIPAGRAAGWLSRTNFVRTSAVGEWRFATHGVTFMSCSLEQSGTASTLMKSR